MSRNQNWMKKIVIKMRSMKKMVGDDLLKLALMLSLLKVGDLSTTFSHDGPTVIGHCMSLFVNKSHGSWMWAANNHQRGSESAGLY